jgi:hypothetical protein
MGLLSHVYQPFLFSGKAEGLWVNNSILIRGLSLMKLHRNLYVESVSLWLVNNILERILKETVTSNLRYFPIFR